MSLPPSVRSLLAYLLYYRGCPMPREGLVKMFWCHTDPHRARSCLTSTLCRARQGLAEHGVDPGSIFGRGDRDSVSVRPEALAWNDVDEVLECERDLEGSQPLDGNRLQEVLGLFRGPLLEDQPGHWIAPERRRLATTRLRLLNLLLRDRRARGEFDECIRLAELSLQLDPLAEEVHRELISVHVERGEIAKGIAAYERCRRILRDELGALPSPATRQLVKSDRRLRDRTESDRPMAQLQRIHEELRSILNHLDVLQGQVRDAMDRESRRNESATSSGTRHHETVARASERR